MVDTSTNSWKLLYETGRQALQHRKLQEAEQSFSAALQLAEDFAPADPRLAATLNALARIYSLQRRYLAAAALLNRLLEVTERTLGTSHVQVAGVLTNLAEMYTHLGAAREELELRERVLGIRADDPNADTTSVQRLRDRVAELRTMLAEQETTAELDEAIEQEPLPIVRTADYSAPTPKTREPETEIELEMEIVSEPIVARTPAPSPVSEPVVNRDDAYRMSPATAQLSIAPWPGVAATGNTPASAEVVETEESFSYDGEPKAAVVAAPAVQMISIEQHAVMPVMPGAATDHGFSDMGRDELPFGVARKIGGRSSLYSIAAGVVLVFGLLAARDYVKSSSEERISTGSVTLATATPARVSVAPDAQTAPAPAPMPEPEPRTVERMIADRRAEQETRRATEQRESSSRNLGDAPRAPSAIDIEKTLRGMDVAAKTIDQRAKAAADSAIAIRMQAPTFKKVKMSDNPQP